MKAEAQQGMLGPVGSTLKLSNYPSGRATKPTFGFALWAATARSGAAALGPDHRPYLRACVGGPADDGVSRPRPAHRFELFT